MSEKRGMTMRLIDADAKELRQRININFGSVTRFIVKSILKDAPTIEAEPVKHGRVVTSTDRWHTMHQNCSECGEELEWNAYPNYCPNCGAKMDGDTHA